MPRKPAKELENTEKTEKSTVKEEKIKKEPTKKSTSTTVKSKVAVASKNATPKTSSKSSSKSSTKKTASKNTSTKKGSVEKLDTKKTTSKKSNAKKAAPKKESVEKATTKKSTTKNSTTSKSAVKKTTRKTTKKSSTTKKVVKAIDVDEITSQTDLTHKIEVLEYYDLPYRYNQTVVKVLAQTPTTLFIYWDISDVDRANFVKQYGEDFFNCTKPVLVIHNNTMHYSFEIEIDDFANSWYLHVNDSNCEYTVELGRRAKYYNEERHINMPNNYLYVTSSNVIDSPNDCVLFDKNLKTVYFKDVKTNIVTAKDITSVSFLRNMGRIYNLYDLQSDFNKNSWINSDHWQLDLKNPSSSNPSSTFK